MKERIRMALLGALIEKYGFEEGVRTAGAVTPGILGDFENMLKALRAGERTREEYRLEDGGAVITLTGYADASGRPVFDGLLVDGRDLLRELPPSGDVLP